MSENIQGQFSRMGSARVYLDMSIGRYPGPVWTALLWTVLSGANLLFAVLFAGNNKAASLATNLVTIFTVLASVAMAILADRTPRWFLWAVVSLGITGSTWLVYDALTPLGSALFALPYVIYASYSALWGSRRLALAFLGVMAVAYLTVLELKGELPLLFVGWILLMSICTGLVFLLGYLVNHLQQLAVMDPLTGLLNRTGLEMMLESESAISRTWPRTVVIMDLDKFKAINDEQGHAAGDATLREFGAVLRRTLRPDDFAIRTGGDEFMLILPGTSTQSAVNAIERLRSATTVRWSFGMADWPEGTDIDDAVALADQRMYEEKSGTE